LDYDNIKKLVFYFYEDTPDDVGGGDTTILDGEHLNDCLYYTLKYYFPTKIRTMLISPAHLQSSLRFRRCDLININLIPKVEKMINCKINLYGDHMKMSSYNTGNKSAYNHPTKNIGIFIKNRYYSPRDKFIKHVGQKRRHVECTKIYSYKNQGQLECYTGEDMIYLNKEQSDDLLYNESNVMAIKCKKNIMIERQEYIDTANILLDKSRGLINMFRTNGYKNTALQLFNDVTTMVKEPEPVDIMEANRINESTMCAMTYNEDYTGYGYKVDVKSQFPFMMQDARHVYPVKAGEFVELHE
jgi:hypothetical protein